MIYIKSISALLIAFSLAGCGTPRPPLGTPSGNPEVLIPGVTRKQVADRIVDQMTGKGLTIRSVSEYKIVAGKKADQDFAARLLFGSRYDSVPEYRMNFTLIDQSGTVKVYGRVEIVTNPGSAFERVNDMTDQSKNDIQDMLARLRSGFEGSEGTTPAAPTMPTMSPAPTVPLAATPMAVGKETYQVERMPEVRACNANPRATLSGKGPGIENYSVACSNGDFLSVRCEFSNCRVLR